MYIQEPDGGLARLEVGPRWSPGRTTLAAMAAVV